jgi:hypothetical protein
MDKFQQRAADSLRTRNEDAIRTAAERVKEYAGYVLRDLERGRTSSYAGSLLADAQVIVTRSAALEALGEMGKILEAEA